MVLLGLERLQYIEGTVAVDLFLTMSPYGEEHRDGGIDDEQILR